MPEMESIQGESFLCPFVQQSRQMAHPALTRAFLQPAATATMHCQPERCTHPPPPVPPFLLAQNLSSKRIVPADNMRSKSDDAKSVIGGKRVNLIQPRPFHSNVHAHVS